MIVRFEELQTLAGTVSMVDGCFDPLHAGHVRYIRQARLLGFPVLCNVAPDTYVTRKHRVLLPLAERCEVLDALRDIDYVLPNDGGATESVLRALRPRYYVKGVDWRDRLPETEVIACRELGIEIVYVDTVTNSSSRILQDFLGETERSR